MGDGGVGVGIGVSAVVQVGKQGIGIGRTVCRGEGRGGERGRAREVFETSYAFFHDMAFSTRT